MYSPLRLNINSLKPSELSKTVSDVTWNGSSTFEVLSCISRLGYKKLR
jgi:hypothetical protein